MRSIVGATFHDDFAEPTPTDLTRWGAVLTMLEALQPRTAVEAMLAGQLVTTHNAILDCYIRAMQGDLPEELVARHRAAATVLIKAQETLLRGLERKQGKPVPPPLPDVPVAVDAKFEVERARQEREEGSVAGLPDPVPAVSASGAPVLRPAIVIPRLVPRPLRYRTAVQQKIATLHAAIHGEWDEQHVGGPDVWYARQVERAEARKRAAASPQAANDPGPDDAGPRNEPAV
jgi:hypothetical protein